jgi:hypothetical protein
VQLTAPRFLGNLLALRFFCFDGASLSILYQDDLVLLIGFVLRTKGRQHEAELGRQSDWPGPDTVIQIAGRTSEELIAFAEQLEGDEEVGLPYLGKTYHYPERFFLVHAMEHSTEHRTEVKLALAHIGIETPDLDGWQYAQSAGYGQEMTTQP